MVSRVIGFGNCDGATALALAKGAGLDGLLLSNPWVIESDTEAAPPAAVRAHYAQRLKDPRAMLRLLGGKVSLSGLFASLRNALSRAAPPSSLAQEVSAGVARFKGPVTILLADRDRTAQVFDADWDKADPRVQRCAGATHSYVESQDWLEARVLDTLGRV